MPNAFVDEIEIYRAAWALMQGHGADEAEEYCEERAENSRRRGDALSIVAWRAIKGAITDFEWRRVH